MGPEPFIMCTFASTFSLSWAWYFAHHAWSLGLCPTKISRSGASSSLSGTPFGGGCFGAVPATGAVAAFGIGAAFRLAEDLRAGATAGCSPAGDPSMSVTSDARALLAGRCGTPLAAFATPLPVHTLRHLNACREATGMR